MPPPEQKWASGETSAHLLLEGVLGYAIYMLDRTGRIVSWDVSAELIKGYQATEVLGKHFSIFYVPEDQGEPLRLLLAAVDGRVEDEGWRVRKDGSRFWANVVITPVRDRSGWLIGFAKVTRALSDPQKQEEQRPRSPSAAEMPTRRSEFFSQTSRTVDSALVAIRDIRALRSTVDTLSGESASAKLNVLEWALDRLARSVKEALEVAGEAGDTLSDEHKR